MKRYFFAVDMKYNLRREWRNKYMDRKFHGKIKEVTTDG